MISGRTLKVSVNLLWLAPGRVGGSEQYLTRQLAGLPPDAPIAPQLFCQPAFVNAHPELSARFATTPMPLRRDWRGGRIVAEHTWFAAKARGADVVHHGGGTVPAGSPKPVLLTVHDLQYLTFPANFSLTRLTYLRTTMPRSVARAALIATPSWYVRGTVIDAFGVPADRVVVVPHGVPDVGRPSADKITTATSALGLRGRYVVYPAITHPHKGHAVLIEMLRHLDDMALVLIGGRGAAESALQRAIASAGVGPRVVRAGYVDASMRDALVAGAEALVFPSEYEGFGAPLIEAMHLGTPVVCSDAPAVREVVADAGIVVPERDGLVWAAAVTAAVQRREQLVAAGIDRSAAYTLAVSGAALADAYAKVGNG